MRPSVPATFLAAALLLGCHGGAPTPSEPAPPRTSFTNGPAELPNVGRGDAPRAFAIVDLESGLEAIAGFPEDIENFIRCGGTEPPELWDLQVTGGPDGVPTALFSAKEITIRVYDYTTYTGPCTSTPLAIGTGHAVVLDNEFGALTQRGNAVNYRMQGTLTEVATGDPVRLTAALHITVRPNDTFLLWREVKLHPVGAP